MRLSGVLLVFSHLTTALTFQAEIFPAHDVFVWSGSELVLECQFSPCPDATSPQNLFFTLSTLPGPVTQNIASEYQHYFKENCTVILQIPNASKELSGNYRCAYDGVKKNKADTSMAKLVKIVDRPQRPSPTCIINNFEDMNCSWCSATNQDRVVTWSFEFSVESVTDIRSNCTVTNSCSCHICGAASYEKDNHHYGQCREHHNIKQFQKNGRYTFNITAGVGGHLSERWTYYFNATLNHVKPGKVTKLGAEMKSESALIRWKPPLGLLGFHKQRKLSYRIGYTYNGQSAQVITNHASYRLKDLKPYSSVDVYLQAKPVVGGYWSDNATLSLITPQSDPKGCVFIAPGGFRSIETKCNPSDTACTRTIQVYWEHISKESINGELLGYTITLLTPRYERREVGSEATSAKFTVAANKQALVSVDARNRVSSTSHIGCRPITIPPQETMPEIPLDVQTEQNGSHLLMTYIGPPSAEYSNYTAMICLSDDQQTCQEVTRIHVIRNIRERWLELPSPSRGKNYIIGVSGTGEEESSGFGKSWLCLLNYTGVIQSPQFHVTSSGDPGALDLAIPPRACDKSLGLILSYNIKWAIENCTQGASRCSQGQTVMPYRSTGNNFTIEGLQGGYTYRVAVTALGRNGRNASTILYSFAHKGSVWRTETSIIIGIILGLLCLSVFIGFLISKARNWWKSQAPVLVRPPDTGCDKRSIFSGATSLWGETDDYERVRDWLVTIKSREKYVDSSGLLPVQSSCEATSNNLTFPTRTSLLGQIDDYSKTSPVDSKLEILSSWDTERDSGICDTYSRPRTNLDGRKCGIPVHAAAEADTTSADKLPEADGTERHSPSCLRCVKNTPHYENINLPVQGQGSCGNPRPSRDSSEKEEQAFEAGNNSEEDYGQEDFDADYFDDAYPYTRALCLLLSTESLERIPSSSSEGSFHE